MTHTYLLRCQVPAPQHQYAPAKIDDSALEIYDRVGRLDQWLSPGDLWDSHSRFLTSIQVGKGLIFHKMVFIIFFNANMSLQ